MQFEFQIYLTLFSTGRTAHIFWFSPRALSPPRNHQQSQLHHGFHTTTESREQSAENIEQRCLFKSLGTLHATHVSLFDEVTALVWILFPSSMRSHRPRVFERAIYSKSQRSSAPILKKKPVITTYSVFDTSTDFHCEEGIKNFYNT